jgi:hypothetical protein
MRLLSTPEKFAEAPDIVEDFFEMVRTIAVCVDWWRKKGEGGGLGSERSAM